MPQRRAEEELMRMAGNPMDVGPPAGMMPDMPLEEPMEEPPMHPDEMMDADPVEMGLPMRAVVLSVSGDTVVLQADDGQELTLPMSAFPIPPAEGMVMVQAEVLDVTEDAIVAGVGENREPIDIPAASLNDVFNIGDLFWMPEPPAGPDMMMEEPVY